MGVVRKVVNYLCDTLTPKVDGAIDHLPARFNGTFDDSTRNLTMVIESQGTSTENLTAVVNIPGGGSGGPTYSAGNGINITSTNAIEIDTGVTATKQSVDTLQAQVGDAFTEVAIGADGKSLDFTALDGQVNNIVLPSSGDSQSYTLTTWGNMVTILNNAKHEDCYHVIAMSYDSATHYCVCDFTFICNYSGGMSYRTIGITGTLSFYEGTTSNPNVNAYKAIIYNYDGANILATKLNNSFESVTITPNALVYYKKLN